MPGTEIRRVVTGHDEQGRAVFVDDRRVSRTRHAWRNHGTTPARVVAFLVGAHHQHVPPA